VSRGTLGGQPIIPTHGRHSRRRGRKADTWDRKGLTASSERFDYEYQEQELREFVQPVSHLAAQARRVHVVFNNNLRDQGIRGARLFNFVVGSNT